MSCVQEFFSDLKREPGKEKTLGKVVDNDENSCRQVESHEDDGI